MQNTGILLDGVIQITIIGMALLWPLTVNIWIGNGHRLFQTPRLVTASTFAACNEEVQAMNSILMKYITGGSSSGSSRLADICEIHELTFTRMCNERLTLNTPAASILADARSVRGNYIYYAVAGDQFAFFQNDYSDLVIELSNDGSTLSWYNERGSSHSSGEFTVYLFPEEGYHFVYGN